MQKRSIIVFSILVVCIGLIFLISILFKNKEKFIYKNTAVPQNSQIAEPDQEKTDLDQTLENIRTR